ncbi:MAG: HNH endonuclease [Planctomycetes bacterium]|nr:HNH endonuclease [Planctomycetota bacterium]MBU1517339.1 HNH endonuclease [Planctomycetota bacterium]MBU2458443.1 HNH endonuclease [Planctomycetota bacterium]MBU2597326.1 HNH endonuclease [Planctomycetota bacterium]
MPKCIFCKTENGTYKTISHILPESLGGKQWACLPQDLECDDCNDYFGSKVERLALNSFPFLEFRSLLGIPTKKNKSPKQETSLGTIKGTLCPGIIGLDPKFKEIEKVVSNGQITQLRILAEPTESLAICRLLLKMGLEVVANDSFDDAMKTKFDAAREFARKPLRGSKWWFLLCCNHKLLFTRFINGITLKEWTEGIKLEVINIEGGEMFHIKLLDMSLITPLEKRILPGDLKSLSEPDYRLFWSEC